MNAQLTAASQPLPLSAFSEDQLAAALARFELVRPALEDNVLLARLARELNQLVIVTPNVVAAARESLVIGAN